MRKTTLTLLVIILVVVLATYAQDIRLPLKKDSVRFAAIGDNGTGGKAEYQVAERLAAARRKFPFEFVVMMGDNLYGGDTPKDFARKFETPYKPLLDIGVKFYATLGNH